MNKIKQLKDRLFFKIKRDFVDLLRSEESIKSIGISFGIGTFVALMPVPGLCTLVALGLVAIFKKLSKIAIFLAIALYNGLTIIPFYWLGLVVGGYLLGDEPIAANEIDYANIMVQYGKRFVMGTLIVIIPYSIASYYFAVWLIHSVKFKRMQKS